MFTRHLFCCLTLTLLAVASFATGQVTFNQIAITGDAAPDAEALLAAGGVGRLTRRRNGSRLAAGDVQHSHVLINQILKELLPAAGVGGRFAPLEHHRFERFKIVLARFDVGPQARIPTGVALFYE